MFERLARLINKAPWVIVGVAIAFAAIGGIFGGPVAKSLQVGGFQDPSSQSTVAVARLQSASGVRSDGGLVAQVVAGANRIGRARRIKFVARRRHAGAERQ